MFLDKSGVDECSVVRVTNVPAWRMTGMGAQGAIAAARIGASEWTFAVGHGSEVLERLRATPVKLGDVSGRIFQGLVTGADAVFVLECTGHSEKLTAFDRVHSARNSKSSGNC